MKKLFLTLILSPFLLQLNAQDTFKVTPTGRLLLDGAIFDSDNKDFANGLAIPDVRLGVKASYGDYQAKIDVGFAYGKVSPKDMYIERLFAKKTTLRGGYFVQPFGLHTSTSSSTKETMEEQASNQAFYNSRTIGAVAIHNDKQYYATLGAFVESEAIKKTSNEMGKQAFGLMSRLLYRPFREEGKILHVGLSGGFEKPRYNANPNLNHSSFTLSASYPTKIAKLTAIEAVVTDAKHLFKLSPEFVMAYKGVALETQYYYTNIKRENDSLAQIGQSIKNYSASGVYVTLRGLLGGRNYKYSDFSGGFSTPDGGSMECVISYDYADLSNKKTDIRGGRLNDIAFVFNYYINKYITWRARYSYTHVSNRTGFKKENLNTYETRIQIIF